MLIVYDPLGVAVKQRVGEVDTLDVVVVVPDTLKLGEVVKLLLDVPQIVPLVEIVGLIVIDKEIETVGVADDV